MDSHTLRNCLVKINNLTDNSHLTGVYSADRLPRKCKKPLAIIAHSEPASISIGHWIAIYAPKTGPIQYFDSFGLKPHIITHINFMHRLGGKVICNTHCYQSYNAITCGGYALMFLASKMGYINNIKKYLSENTAKNDSFIKMSTEQLVAHLGV
jgi:hypothetical protein